MMKPSTTNDEESKAKSAVPFVKEVARYFMDFLETDFHKTRNPKRHIKYRNNNNLQICINLAKYKKYNSLAWKVIRSSFQDDAISELSRGVHVNQISQTLLQLIEYQIASIRAQDITTFIKLFENEITIGLSKYSQDTTAAISYALEGIARVINEKFISIFITKIREPLEKIRVATVDSIYQLEEELTGILTAPFEDAIPSIINQLSLEKEVNITKQLSKIFELQDIQEKLESFFKGFSVGDLYLEVLELVNNKTLLDKQELYLYFCDITYENYTYPLFYIPIQIEKNHKGFVFNFDSLLYVNKKAIQFIAQNYNLEIERKGSLNTFLERIIYLSENQNHLIDKIDLGLKEAINYFDLTPFIDLNNPEQQTAKGKKIHITNRCYLGLFEKSDESLINDYEDILQRLNVGNDYLATAFRLLIDDFITNNPVAVISEVEEEWDETPFSEKLVYASPVPLNEEQRQILMALNKNHCKYITVEGPPGTGKSHTITAIVCDAILKNQSVLVLSDKKEALDVVEDKITETINKIRLDKNLQNPILRLGRAGNTYSKILSTPSMEKIKENYKATKSNYQKLEENFEKFSVSLKDEINCTVAAYNKIKFSDISEFTMLEVNEAIGKSMPIDLIELQDNTLLHDDLVALRGEMTLLKSELLKEGLDNLFKKFYPDDQSLDSFHSFLTFTAIIDGIRSHCGSSIESMSKIRNISESGLMALENFVDQCQKLKSSMFGYFFKRKKIDLLCQELNVKVPNNFEQPHHKLDQLKQIISVFQKSLQYKLTHEMKNNFQFKLDFIENIHQLVILNINVPNVNKRKSLLHSASTIKSLLDRYKNLANQLCVNKNNIFSFVDNKLTQCANHNFDQYIKYLHLKNKLTEEFGNIPQYNYAEKRKSIEEIVTAKMAYVIDERVVNFLENYRNDAKTLSGIISKKQRFDTTAFGKLKKSFPCILVGIRDFAEYIPLESEIFDIVIIDEASQVSIAQAFPALLRGKKIVVLGDKHQFSNVKSAQASSTTNHGYLNRLRDIFTQTISEEPIKLNRLEKFNIKTSTLEFFERISNYNILLKKHFRGYKELISYSNKYFYDESLQAIKIRSKHIDEVIKFIHIAHDSRAEIISNTNQLEINAIVSEVEKIAKNDKNSTIGIITPHTNQQKLLYDIFLKHSDNEYFYKNHKLKIMTFDTCQGEERDIILYSMVANDFSDKLWGIFIKDRKSYDFEENGQIKLQRLNVGFSRAKECIQFFISKPIEAFNGSIGEVFRHYYKVLEDAKKLPEIGDTDPRSPMEKKVWVWIQETTFFKENSSFIEIRFQFPLGDYLKQLDKRYSHPLYVVDFLLIYTDKEKKTHKIIIEYDGFEYHFQDGLVVDSSNYGEYYTEEHVYREKTLEGYGYNFLRINRFNIGKNPVEMLNQRLKNLVKKTSTKLFNNI